MPQSEETPSQESGTNRRSKRPQSPDPDTGPTCGQCKHWRRDDGDEGVCFRYPPTLYYDGDSSWTSRPPIDSTEPACGEFRGAN